MGMNMYVCPQCHLMWVREKPIADEYYDSLQFDLSPGKLNARLRNCRDRLTILKNHTGINQVCDIGTGEGMFVDVVHQAGGQNAWGIEPSAQGSETAKKNHLEVMQGTIADLPRLIQERPASVVTMFHVIEHLDDPLKEVQTIYDALPSGGYFVCETPNLRGFTATRAGDRWKLIYPEHLFYFDEENLPKLLSKVGFTVTASGRRDFDQYHLSLGESLWRLGQRQKTFKGPAVSGDRKKFAPPTQAEKKAALDLIKEPLRTLLSHLVVKTGRLDYIWAVARKD